MRRLLGIAIGLNLLASAWYLPYLYTKIGRLPAWTDLGVISTMVMYIILSVYAFTALVEKK